MTSDIRSRQTRVVRGVVAALVCVLVAALSHAAGGGSFPATPVLMLGFVVATSIGTLLAGRGISWWRLGIVVGASQSLFHALFALGGGSSAPLVSTMPAAGALPPLADGAGHAHSAALVVQASAHPAHADPRMMLAHVAAAAITLVALRLGEGAFWGIVAVARDALACVFRGVRAEVRILRMPEAAPAGMRPETPRGFLRFSQLRYRGPPAITAL